MMAGSWPAKLDLHSGDFDSAAPPGRDHAGCEQGRRVEYFQEAIDVAIHPKEKYMSATDGVSLMQEGRSSASLTARRVGQRVDRPTRQWLEEAIADFRQIVDQGSGRVARRQLLQLLAATTPR